MVEFLKIYIYNLWIIFRFYDFSDFGFNFLQVCLQVRKDLSFTK